MRFAPSARLPDEGCGETGRHEGAPHNKEIRRGDPRGRPPSGVFPHPRNSCKPKPLPFGFDRKREPLNRRQLLRVSLAVSTAAVLPRAAASESAAADVQFAPSYVRDLARSIASKPFEPPDEKLPDALKDLNYDQYRSIRFLPEHA